MSRLTKNESFFFSEIEMRTVVFKYVREKKREEVKENGYLQELITWYSC